MSNEPDEAESDAGDPAGTNQGTGKEPDASGLGSEHFMVPDKENGGWKRGYEFEEENEQRKIREQQGLCTVLLSCGHFCSGNPGHVGHYCDRCTVNMP